MRLISAHDGKLLTLDAGCPTNSPVENERAFSSGIPVLDAIAPGGAFARGAIHELLTAPEDGQAVFIAMLLSRASCSLSPVLRGEGWGEGTLVENREHGANSFSHPRPLTFGPSRETTGFLIWCDPAATLYPPALAAHGFPLDRLLLLHPKIPDPNGKDLLWAMTECLRCKGVSAVVGAVPRLSRLQARRLQLAAETGGGVGLLLRHLGRDSLHHASASRWLIRPAPGGEPFNAGRSSFFTATEGASDKPSAWSIAVKQIICIRLTQWPIDRLRRSRLRDNSRITGVPPVPPFNQNTGETPVIRETRGVFDLKKNARTNRKTKTATSSPYPFPVDHSKPMRHDLWFGRDSQKHESCNLKKVSGFQTAAKQTQNLPRDMGVPPMPGAGKLNGFQNDNSPTPFARAGRPCHDQPLLIVRTVADRQVIVCLSPEASAFGIRAGMTLTQARALCAHVQHAEHEPLRDSRAMEAMARCLMRFSPVVSLTSGTGILPVSKKNGKLQKHGQDAHATCGGIFLDLTGCDRLFGGMPNLVRQIHDALAHLRITARLAVAPTPGAAWALAEAGKNETIVSPDELIAALSPLPPAALRLSADLVAALHHLGLGTIGQVIDLPRDVLPARFGKELLHRLDQALGYIAEPLTPLEHHAPVEAKMEFDGPVSSLEAIHAVARRLLQQVIEQLTHRGQGARRLDLELSRAYAEPVKKSILLSHPSREMRSLFNLMVCALEEGQGKFEARNLKSESNPNDQIRKAESSSFSRRLQSPELKLKPLNIHGDGYTAFHLRVPLLQRLSEEQIFLLEQEQHASRVEVDRLIDRLRLRLGEAGAVRVKLVESHLPEKAWTEEGEMEKSRDGETRRWGEGDMGKGETRRTIQIAHISPRLSVSASSRLPISPSPHLPLPPSPRLPIPIPIPIPRPLHLLPTPVELRVMVTPSDAIEGRPAAFVYEHQVHKVMHCAGPERIAGCWWDGHTKTRDYYEVENPAGRRFWIFRVGETARWYLHGNYE